MTLQIAPDALVRLALASDLPGRDLLVAAVRSAPVTLTVSGTVKADHLLPIYRTRHSRWVAEGIPQSVGLPELVAALEQLGDDEVVIAPLEGPNQHFTLLLSPNMDLLHGLVAIDRPASVEPDASSSGSTET